jgi:amidophosphoribosyltransferase
MPLPIECGLFGLCSPEATEYEFNLTIDCIQKLQHRGQDSFGISYFQKHNSNINAYCYPYVHLYSGLVESYIKSNTLKDNQINYGIRGTNNIICHLRYKTSGKSGINEHLNMQPFTGRCSHTGELFALAHNGNVKNTDLLFKILLKVCPTYSEYEQHEIKERSHDTYYLLKIIENIEGHSMAEKLCKFINIVTGVYSLLVLTKDAIYAIRDRFGVRPLSIGCHTYTKDSNTYKCYMVASESVAFPDNNSQFVRDVENGELVKIKHSGYESIYKYQDPNSHTIASRHCLFEYIYFLRPETFSDNLYVSDVRSQYGKLLANKELTFYIGSTVSGILYNNSKNICINKPINYNNPSDYIVIGSPSSGIVAAQEYAKCMGLQYKQAIQKQKNIRSFIQKNDKERQNACHQKFVFTETDIIGKKIILVDDSLVRGNTCKTMIQVLKTIGVLEVHVRIASPPVQYPCYFGIDIPSPQELIAYQNTVVNITNIIDADSLIYLDLSDIKKIHNNNICHSCFSGKYESKLLEW